MRFFKKAGVLLAAASIVATFAGCNSVESAGAEETASLFEKSASTGFMLFGDAGPSAVTVPEGKIPLAWVGQDGLSYACSAVKGKNFVCRLYVYAGGEDTVISSASAGALWAPEGGSIPADKINMKTKLPMTVKKGGMGYVEFSAELPAELPNGIYRSVAKVVAKGDPEVSRELRFEVTVTASEKEKVSLASGGASEWTLVKKAGMSESEAFAMEEFASFFEKATGVRLAVRDENEAKSGKEIVIGAGKRTQAAGLSDRIATLGDDGFIIDVSADSIYIAGSAVRGTLYGVYSFLEDYVGFKWLDSKFTVVPDKKKLSVPFVTRTDVPKLIYREPFYMDAFSWEFAARNKSNGNATRNEVKQGGKLTYAGSFFVHTANFLVPPSVYGQEHPEYYAMINGQRVSTDSQLCLTNPDVLRITIAKVKEWLAADPNAKYVSVSQNDNQRYCTCPACAAVDAEEGSPSGTLIRFVNAVAAAIKEEYPNVLVDTLAYQYTRQAPKITKPADNVIIRLCSIECCFLHSFDKCTYKGTDKNGKETVINAAFVKDLKDWAKITDQLFVWDYTVDFAHYQMPYPNLGVLRDNIITMVENNVTGIMEQGCYNTLHGENSELKAYILAKMLWNQGYPQELAENEFLTGYYGRASAPIREYLDYLEAKAQAFEGLHQFIFDAPKELLFNDEYMDRANAYFNKAESLASSDDELTRIKIARIPVRFCEVTVAKISGKKKAQLRKEYMDDLVKYGVTLSGESTPIGN